MAGLYNIIAEEAATLTRHITWQDSEGTPVNLTGYTAKLDVRSKDDTLLIGLTNSSGIALGGALGTIVLNVAATTTATWTPGMYEFDLFLTSGAGVATRLIAGFFEVIKAVTE